MVQIVLFDTETNGLPKHREITGNIKQNNWPDILSICWMVYEGTNHVKTEYHLIKPEGWEVKYTEIHGITTEALEKDGKPLTDIMMLFKADVEKSKYVIAHNLQFDKNVVFSAFKWHINMEPSTFWSSDKDFCTACHALSALKLPKFPRLDDMYTLVFQKPAPEGAHNALRDVEVLRDIFFATWGKTMLNASKGGTLRKKNKKQRKSQSVKY